MCECEHMNTFTYVKNSHINVKTTYVKLVVHTAIFENLKLLLIQGKYIPEYGWTGACISNMGHRDREHSHSIEDDGAMATAELS